LEALVMKGRWSRHRKNPIVLRWLDVVRMTVVFVALLVVSQSALVSAAEWATKHIGARPAWLQSLCVVFANALIWWALIRLGGFHFRHFNLSASLCYPPGWWAAIVTLVCHRLVFPTMENRWLDGAATLMLVAAGAGLAILVEWLWPAEGASYETENPGATQHTHVAPDATDLEDPRVLEDWLRSDQPIQTPDQDLLGTASIARRIAQILRTTPLNTVGLTGPYGSGKSSVLRLVEHFLRTDRSDDHGASALVPSSRIVTVFVGGWGFTRDSVVQHTLSAAVRQMAKHVDCLALVTIPSHYAAAISSSGSPWAKPLASVLNRGRDPLDVLRRLDNVLACTGHRLVIYLEDLDRNAIPAPLVPELAALLDRLKSLEHVSFVLAITRRQQELEDLVRVAEHLEIMPSVPIKRTANVITAFRDLCLDRYPNDVDCLAESRKDRLGSLTSDRSRDMSYAMGFDPDTRFDPLEAMAGLLGCPRPMKAGLRNTLTCWDSLHGELDFDSLLAANILRAGAPQAFAYVAANIDRLRRLHQGLHGSRDAEQELRATLETQWDKAGHDAAWNRIAARCLVEFLFPEHGAQISRNPQTVAVSHPTDYWVRFNAGELQPGEVRDQCVLKSIELWRSTAGSRVDDQPSLAEAIVHTDGFADKVREFGGSMSGEEVRTLAQEVFAIIKTECGNEASCRHTGPPQLQALAVDRHWDGHEDWLAREIRRAIPVSLRFACELYLDWRHESSASLAAPTENVRLSTELVAAARETYQGNPDALVAALGPHDIDRHTPIHLLRGHVQSRAADAGDSSWFPSVVLDAMEASPAMVLPHVTAILVEEDVGDLRRFEYRFHEDRANAFFGNEVTRLMRLLAEKADMTIYDSRINERVTCARRAASEYLARHSDGEPPSAPP